MSVQCTELCKATILLVDDTAFNLIPLDGMLQQTFGITSVQFTSGFEAISCFQKKLLSKCCKSHFKLILTDIQMPQMDGFKLSTMIKSIENVWHGEIKKPGDIRRFKAQKKCPIVAITASDLDSVME